MEKSKLLKRKRKAVNENNETLLASSCTDLGDFYIKKGRYNLAIKEYEIVAGVYKKGNKLMKYAQANQAIAEAYLGLQNFEKALEVQLLNLSVAIEENNKLEQQRALATRGHIFLTWYLEKETDPEKNLNSAHESFIESLNIAESLTGINKLEKVDMVARLFSNLGLVKGCLGDYNQALELLNRSIGLCKQHEMFTQLHRSYLSLGSLYEKQGKSNEAIRHYNLAIDSAKKLDGNVDLICAGILLKSEALIKVADFRGAKHTLLKAYKLKTPNIQDRKMIEHNLRIVATMCITEDKLVMVAENESEKMKLYDKMGDGACELKNYGKAIEYYKLTLECALKNGVSGRDLAWCYHSLAVTYKDNNQFSEAVEYYEKGHALCTDLEDSLDTLSQIADTKEEGGAPVSEVKAVYERAFAECRRCRNLKEEKQMVSRCITYLRRHNKDSEIFELNQHLSNLGDFSDDDSSSCEIKSKNSEAEGCFGDDIDLENITDDSNDSDIENQQPAAGTTVGQGWLNELVEEGWLHEVCMHGHLEMVRFLLDMGAAINHRDGTHCNGNTPLYVAAENGHLKVVELLLDRGASAVAKMDDGETPLQVLQEWQKSNPLQGSNLVLYWSLVKRMSEAQEKDGQSLKSIPSVQTSCYSARGNSRTTERLSQREINLDENSDDEEGCSSSQKSSIDADVPPTPPTPLVSKRFTPITGEDDHSDDSTEDDLQASKLADKRKTNTIKFLRKAVIYSRLSRHGSTQKWSLSPVSILPCPPQQQPRQAQGGLSSNSTNIPGLRVPNTNQHIFPVQPMQQIKQKEGEMNLQNNRINNEINSESMDEDDVTVNDEPDLMNEEPHSPDSSEDTSNATSTGGKRRSKIFKPDELRQKLMPTLEKLFGQDPESIPFRQPVGLQTLDTPDYFDVVERPMDLSTIRRKLHVGQYADPWGFVDDVWLMFNNAWLYNGKTSRVYGYCTKLSEVFEQDIDPVMRSMGYCCGRRYTFNAQALCCYGRQLCTILKDAKYYSYQNSPKAYGLASDRYTFCQKCFNDIQGDTVTLGDDPTQAQTVIKKDQFKEMKNDLLEMEAFIHCTDCGRKLHQICVLYIQAILPQGFTCDECLELKGQKRQDNKFSAKRLPITKLGTYIENRINTFLKKTEAGAGKVSVRVVSSSKKVVQVKPGMRSKFVETGELSGEFPYRAKSLFAFQEVDGVDLCFFGMHTQEYGSECPPPNTKRVYIAYLDSVHFFKPRRFRTAVYHEILLGYMYYVKCLGYTMAHIWACPPSEGDDYIFHCHPLEQKIPKPERLQDWYKQMLDKGISKRIIIDYKDIKQAVQDSFKSAAELPYFEGDFWPNVLEDSIKELNQAEAAMSSMEESEVGLDRKKKGKKKAKKNTKSKANQRGHSNEKSNTQTGNDLSAKIFATMEKHKEAFIVIRLHSVECAAGLKPIHDPDPFIDCGLMDGRDAFLSWARENHHEFSTLRRAKHSTMSLLFELHNRRQNEFVYTCNICKKQVETRYHCTLCDDFDLCEQCYEKQGHPHKVQKLGLDLDDGSSKRATCIHTQLVHACQCRDADCRLPGCWKMKLIVQHACKQKTNCSCPICKGLIALCRFHAKNCQETECPVPFCSNIKRELKQQQLQQAQLLRRRMAAMTQTAPTANTLPSKQ